MGASYQTLVSEPGAAQFLELIDTPQVQGFFAAMDLMFRDKEAAEVLLADKVLNLIQNRLIDDKPLDGECVGELIKSMAGADQ